MAIESGADRNAFALRYLMSTTARLRCLKGMDKAVAYVTARPAPPEFTPENVQGVLDSIRVGHSVSGLSLDVQGHIAFHLVAFELGNKLPLGEELFRIASTVREDMEVPIEDITDLIVAATEHRIRTDIGSRHDAKQPRMRAAKNHPHVNDD